MKNKKAGFGGVGGGRGVRGVRFTLGRLPEVASRDLSRKPEAKQIESSKQNLNGERKSVDAFAAGERE